MGGETNYFVVVGGGLAGLSTAVRLAERGRRVTLLESRDRLGGRAGSFCDKPTGRLIDNCQHVSMGCCTEWADFCRTVGIGRYLEPQPALYFMTPDRRETRLTADPLPAPLHLAGSFLKAHYLTAGDKLRLGPALLAMARTPPDADPPLLDWLRRHRQSERAIRRFWAIVLTSALNESVERLGLKYARKVFVEGFLRDRDGHRVEVPTVALGRLYGDELRTWLERHGVDVRLNAGVGAVEIDGGVAGVRLRSGERLPCRSCVLALPFDRVLDVLPDSVAADGFFGGVRRLRPSPITSVHLWFDRPVMRRPHVVLIDFVSQWAFDRGPFDGGSYIQVVISASGEARALGTEALRRRVIAEMRHLFPRAASAELLRSKVVTEHKATFSPEPGVDAYRPGQRTPIRGLTLAGDWTQTGWPATMEGAVRSGRLAAEVTDG